MESLAERVVVEDDVVAVTVGEETTKRADPEEDGPRSMLTRAPSFRSQSRGPKSVLIEGLVKR